MRRLQGRYRLEDLISSGGMGSVFAATDERLERLVAVKLPAEGLIGDGSFAERFRREAHAVAALSHPNIAQIYDYGDDSGRPFIVMELVPGPDLAKVLEERQRIACDDALWVAIQVAAALGSAHAHGIVHRDIKPANIIVCDDNLRIKVTDFGIASVAGQARITATSGVFGTPDYLSPEQAKGLPVTSATDLYALGIVLYQMLTGVTPFADESLMARVLRRINEDVPAPSRMVPEIPSKVDRLIENACARTSTQQFADAGEMIEALRVAVDPGSDRSPLASAVTIPMSPTDELPDDSRFTTTPLTITPSFPAAWSRWLASARTRTATLGIAAVIVLLTIIALRGPDAANAPQQTDPAADQQVPGESDGELPSRLTEQLDELERLVQP